MSTPSPPRRRDAVASSVAIERAATDLVFERGYDAVTVDMICDRAGVSQRTFFNHFRTKDAALIGPHDPTIDQTAARHFIVSTAPLLAGAAGLIRIQPGEGLGDPQLLVRRMQIVARNPLLMARQMERLAAVEEELRDIILLRLRTQHPDTTEEHLTEQAELTTHLVAGLMRYIAISWARQIEKGQAPVIEPDHIRRLLADTMTRLM